MNFYLLLCFYGCSETSFHLPPTSPFYGAFLVEQLRRIQCMGGNPYWFSSLKILAKFHVCTKFYIRNDSSHAETELNLNKNKFRKKINEGSCSQKNFCTILSSLLAALENDIQYLKILSRFWADWFWNFPSILPFSQQGSSSPGILLYQSNNLHAHFTILCILNDAGKHY